MLSRLCSNGIQDEVNILGTDAAPNFQSLYRGGERERDTGECKVNCVNTTSS